VINVKIQIIGYSGSGKSTLAKKLSEFYNIPRLYLDTLKYYGNWEERSREDIRKDLQFFLDNNDSGLLMVTILVSVLVDLKSLT
jgi:adenylate kinase family enzyme